MKINLSPEIVIETNFKTIFNFNNGLKKYSTFVQILIYQQYY